jgi:opacity protein-like surface antigen
MVTVKQFLAVAAVTLAMAGRPVRAHARDESEPETPARSSYDQTGRFYLMFEAGHRFIFDDHMIDDVHFDEPNGFDLVLGGAGGYNITEHWGVELQGHGTESDVRSDSLGKLEEYSNITLVPAVKFRWPVSDGRLVPYLTAGVGWSVNDDNDQHDPRVKVSADESTVVGSISAGFDYFVSPNVAVGLTTHAFIFPDQDANVQMRDSANRLIRNDNASFNMSSIALLAHVSIYPGAENGSGESGWLSWLIARHGPYDTDDLRPYAYLLGGHTAMFDHGFGGGVELKDPGDFNATLGAGLCMNLDRNWGLEAQFFNVAPNVNKAPFGKFTEIDNNTFLLMGRFRWPFLQGRLVPYLTAGVGAGTFDINDSRSIVDVPTEEGTAVTAKSPTVHVQATQVAAEAGIGVEYFLNHNVSIGVNLPFYIYPDLATTVQQGNKPPVGGHVNFSGIAPQLQLKAYLN